MFGTTKSWFLVRRGGLSSQSPAEALLRQIEHLFKAHYATKIRFTASETTKVGLNHPKWPRNTLVTILQTCLDIIFGAEKSWFLVCCGGLSNKSPCTSHVTLTDQSSEPPNCLKNHFWDSKTIKNVFNGPKMTYKYLGDQPRHISRLNIENEKNKISSPPRGTVLYLF